MDFIFGTFVLITFCKPRDEHAQSDQQQNCPDRRLTFGFALFAMFGYGDNILRNNFIMHVKVKLNTQTRVTGLLRLRVSRKRRKEETLPVNAKIVWLPESLLSPSAALIWMKKEGGYCASFWRFYGCFL
jgi:hypothetical protein